MYSSPTGHLLAHGNLVRHCADTFLASEHKDIRIEAVRTCSRLLSPSLHVSGNCCVYNNKTGEMIILVIIIYCSWVFEFNLKVWLIRRMNMILLIRNICIQLYMLAVSVSWSHMQAIFPLVLFCGQEWNHFLKTS